MRIKRHFVTIDGRSGTRQVHYRRCGDGPAMLLLHQSPRSSAEFIELIERWGESFTVVAPDHPGYGVSDPLGDPAANMEAFAEALVEFLDAIGLESAAVYGMHTGAGMAVALAARGAARGRGGGPCGRLPHQGEHQPEGHPHLPRPGRGVVPEDAHRHGEGGAVVLQR